MHFVVRQVRPGSMACVIYAVRGWVVSGGRCAERNEVGGKAVLERPCVSEKSYGLYIKQDLVSNRFELPF